MAIYNGSQLIIPSGIDKVYVGSQLVYSGLPEDLSKWFNITYDYELTDTTDITFPSSHQFWMRNDIKMYVSVTVKNDVDLSDNVIDFINNYITRHTPDFYECHENADKSVSSPSRLSQSDFTWTSQQARSMVGTKTFSYNIPIYDNEPGYYDHWNYWLYNKANCLSREVEILAYGCQLELSIRSILDDYSALSSNYTYSSQALNNAITFNAGALGTPLAALINYKTITDDDVGLFAYCFSGEHGSYVLSELIFPESKPSRLCYDSMFANNNHISNITLPATTLEFDCYKSMFVNSSINRLYLCYSGDLYNSIFGTYDYTDNWVNGVPQTGDFYYNGSAIPTGWTVHTF